MSYGPLLIYGLNLPAVPPQCPNWSAVRRRRRANVPAGPPLVFAGWDARPLGDDTDPFGVDPEQTFGTN